MTGTPDLQAAGDVLRSVLDAIDAGELTASDVQRAHIAGALSALDAFGVTGADGADRSNG